MMSRADSGSSISTTGLWRLGGKPTEASNVADAIAAYDYLAGHGVSPQAASSLMGSCWAQARPCGSRRNGRSPRWWWRAPLTSTVDVARSVYFFLPLGGLITDQYNVERDIRAVRAPVPKLDGEQDEVIPVDMGQRVYRAANAPKRIEWFRDGRHNDLFDHGAWEKMRDFALELDR